VAAALGEREDDATRRLLPPRPSAQRFRHESEVWCLPCGVFSIWYQGPDTSPAQHPVSLPVGVAIAVVTIRGPAIFAFMIARRRGHRWAAALALPQVRLCWQQPLSLSFCSRGCSCLDCSGTILRDPEWVAARTKV
jgi:hypothetical protein